MVTVAGDDAIRIERLELGPYGTNAYIVVCLETMESAVVDAPADAPRIIESLKGTSLKYILLTHDHADHIGALEELREALRVPLAAHPLDSKRLSPPPGIAAGDGDILTVGKIDIQVLHTPGHTPGSLGFKAGKYLLAGDTLFPGGPGKTMSPEAFRQLLDTITGKIFALPDETQVFPGHGQPTSVRKAKEEHRVFASRPHPSDLYGDVLWLTS
jgi:glyoxylase-like metal-dependent hydrolase (beta-lactamase superfamily II)